MRVSWFVGAVMWRHRHAVVDRCKSKVQNNEGDRLMLRSSHFSCPLGHRWEIRVRRNLRSRNSLESLPYL